MRYPAKFLLALAPCIAMACGPAVPEGQITRRTGFTSAAEGGQRYIEFVDRRPSEKRPAPYQGDLIFVDLYYGRGDTGIDGYLKPWIPRPMPLEDIAQAPEPIRMIAKSIGQDWTTQEAAKHPVLVK